MEAQLQLQQRNESNKTTNTSENNNLKQQWKTKKLILARPCNLLDLTLKKTLNRIPKFRRKIPEHRREATLYVDLVDNEQEIEPYYQPVGAARTRVGTKGRFYLNLKIK